MRVINHKQFQYLNRLWLCRYTECYKLVKYKQLNNIQNGNRKRSPTTNTKVQQKNIILAFILANLFITALFYCLLPTINDTEVFCGWKVHTFFQFGFAEGLLLLLLQKSERTKPVALRIKRKKKNTFCSDRQNVKMKFCLTFYRYSLI